MNAILKTTTHTQNTSQIQHDVTHIYDGNGRHIIIIPKLRRQWLWKQYHATLTRSHDLESPSQPFETKLICLYQQYKYKILKNDPLKLLQYTFPTEILEHITNLFQIVHSYFSSPITCLPTFKRLYLPFPKDAVFGSLRITFQYKWQRNGYAHPHTKTNSQQTFHWAHLAAKNLDSVTILVLPDQNWYHNPHPHEGFFLDSHIITHFKVDTIIYEKTTIPP